ncbi:hypothetical protein SAMN03159343_0987 [Klenkia marina]|uniref:Fibronectin type-III domain-containing protein n=1 Tax=Klenkia marina TaxID=1960309 RepID=A0A1G4XH76_9ACTN|nr:fibronectin type III domain-containing protein [Klenkia marina]SCX40541.1 hypothetical protein SAMN03159343_0987 [Klenkia marina]
MRSSLVSRRVLGLAAAGVVGLSTLAMPGIALAGDEVAPAPSIIEPLPQLPLPPVDGTAPAESSPSSESSPSGTTSSDTTAPGGEVAAAAPAAPYLNGFPEGIDGGLRYNFVDQSVAPDLATSFEYTIDNGAHWAPLSDVQVKNNRTYGTVTGLTNGVEYTTKVRAVNASGASDPSNGVTAPAYKKVGPVTGVQVTRSLTGVTVTWADPTSPGTYGIASYGVSWGEDGAQSGGPECEVEPTVHTCTFALPTAGDYGISIIAFDTQFNGGERASVRSGAVSAPAPTAVPTKDDGDIQGPAGPISTLTAGTQVVLKGDGFLAGSVVRLTMFSTPVDLGSAVVASDGTFTATVTVPANLVNGTHHLVATGVDKDGNVRNLVITVTVSGGQATLAVTGFDAVPVAVGGGLVVLAGAGLVLGGRRRSTTV